MADAGLYMTASPGSTDSREPVAIRHADKNRSLETTKNQSLNDASVARGVSDQPQNHRIKKRLAPDDRGPHKPWTDVYHILTYTS